MQKTRRFPKLWVTIGLGTIVILAGEAAIGAESEGIQWLKSLETAKEQAKAGNKLIFMDVYGEWCPPCKKMDSETFSDAAVIKALKDYVALKVDSDKQPSVAREYGVQVLPTFFVLMADGAPIHRQEGFIPAKDFLALLTSAQERMKAIESLEKEVRLAPDNVEKTVQLAGMYIDIGRADDAVNLLEKTEPKVENVESPFLKGDFAFSLGLAYLVKGAYDKGVERLEGFVEAHPSHAQTDRAKDLILRGKVFDALTRVDKGEYDEAKSILTELTKTSTNEQVTTFAKSMLDQLAVLGQPAPVWQVKWLGEKSPSLEQLKGKVVVLAFVEPENGENAQVAQQLEALQRGYGDQGLETVAIVSSLNGTQKTDTTTVKAWVEKHNFNYAIGIDQEGAMTYKLYKGQHAPWVVLIGREGVIHYLGTFDGNQIARKLMTLLNA